LTLESAVPGRATHVFGDPTFTEQALTNLVGNALRYNREGGNVAVVLDIDAGGFTLRVLDDGAGLSDESMARVLERGQRGDSARTRDPMGQGLGLSIVARVATAQHWSFRLYRGDPTGLVAELSGPLSDGSTHSGL
jgi:signal transduction histidine kinase